MQKSKTPQLFIVISSQWGKTTRTQQYKQYLSHSLQATARPPFCSVLTLFTGLLGETEYLLTRAMMIKMTIIRTLVIILGSVTKSLPLRDINTLKSFFFFRNIFGFASVRPRAYSQFETAEILGQEKGRGKLSCLWIITNLSEAHATPLMWGFKRGFSLLMFFHYLGV